MKIGDRCKVKYHDDYDWISDGVYEIVCVRCNDVIIGVNENRTLKDKLEILGWTSAAIKNSKYKKFWVVENENLILVNNTLKVE